MFRTRQHPDPSCGALGSGGCGDLSASAPKASIDDEDRGRWRRLIACSAILPPARFRAVSSSRLRLFEKRIRAGSVPELGCTVTSGRLSLDNAVVIWVDPYSVNGEALVDQVCGLVNQYGLNCCVKERFCRQERKPLYNEFAHLAMKGMYTLDAILASPEISDELRAFLGDLQARGPLYQLGRYLRYLRSGTLNSTGKTSGTGQRT